MYPDKLKYKVISPVTNIIQILYKNKPRCYRVQLENCSLLQLLKDFVDIFLRFVFDIL